MTFAGSVELEIAIARETNQTWEDKNCVFPTHGMLT